MRDGRARATRDARSLTVSRESQREEERERERTLCIIVALLSVTTYSICGTTLEDDIYGLFTYTYSVIQVNNECCPLPLATVFLPSELSLCCLDDKERH